MFCRSVIVAIFCSSVFAFAGDNVQVAAVAQDHAIPLHPLPVRVVGRVLQQGTEHAPSFRRQWPGTYFETAFVGSSAYFKVGAGEVILKVTVDGNLVQSLIKPAAGFYQVRGITAGNHRLRIEVASENQAGATEFNGFYGNSSGKTVVPAPRRQIEFIGDSHTVGYGNTSSKRECSEAEVWATTDTSQSIGPRVAKRYHADYHVDAISGRGIVRNYNGFPGDTLPVAYPYVLFDHATTYQDPSWRPQVIVISLGTNDFSTPLHDGEKWKTRDQLHADYEKTFIKFVHDLRAANPAAYFVIWATDMAEGEISSEVKRVVDQLHARGETRLTFVPLKDLEFSACNFHPSLADDQRIAAAIDDAIDANVKNWKK